MKYAQRVAALAFLFIALLSWAIVRSLSEGEGYGKQTIQVINNLTLNESHLLKDALLARSGLLLTYDPLVHEIAEMRKWSEALKVDAAAWQRDADEVARVVLRKEDALERFKSANALLQNSLAYFDIMATSTADSNEDADFKNKVAAIEAAVMHLLRTSSGADVRALIAKLDDLKRSPHASHPDVDLLYQHGILLVSAIPTTNAAIRTLQEETTLPATKRILGAIDRHRIEIDRQRSVGDVALYVGSFIIFMLLMRTLALLKRDGDALHWTVLRERLAFEASRLFIACPPELVDQRTIEMLQLLTEGYEADRTYVLRLGDGQRVLQWSRREPAKDWPAALFGHVAEILAQPKEAFRIPYDDVRLSKSLRTTIAEAGVKIWSCVKVRLEGNVVALLCFDRSTGLPAGIRTSHDNLHLLANVLYNTFLRQKLYKKRRELEGKLRQAERLEAIGTFTSGVAHNFNNLIGAIAGQAEMAMDILPDGSRAAPHVRQVLQSSARAKEVANQILEFGRIGRGIVQDVAVAPVIDETIAYLRSTIGQEFVVTIPDRDVEAFTRTDPGRLQQVFHNVMLNAIQAASGVAVVEVSVHRMTSCERAVPLGHLGPGAYVRVQVKDHGKGVDPQTLKRICEPFFTTRPTGTGLGLATVLETVNELGGALEIESTVGVGTTVTIWLPESQQRSPAAPIVDPLGRTILVVNADREAVLRDEELLATLGFEPVGFALASKALDAIAAGNGRFDLLIVDERVSGMSVQEFVDRARGSFDGGKRIISTGSYVGVDAASFERLQVSGHLPRPWSPRLLSSMIKDALAV